MTKINIENIDPSRDYISGDPNSQNFLLLYGDYTCNYTRRSQKLNLDISQSKLPNTAFVYRQCPSKSREQASVTASKFALAAGLQNKFWEAHERLFQIDSKMSEESLDALAVELEIDQKRLKTDMNSEMISKHLNDDLTSALIHEIKNTPTLLINGNKYEGAWDELSIIEEIKRPLGIKLRDARESFFHWAAAAGFVLMLATIAALIFVNFGFKETYDHWRETQLGFSFGDSKFSLSIESWVNDGLMAIFFLIVGIEIKREILYGELSSLSKAALPLVGALGGIVVPVIIYLAFNLGLDTYNGWGIPMSTDIAFTLGLMALLGKRVPLPLKVFVSALAIADDLAAILVIAIFYGHGFHVDPFLWAIGILATMLFLNRARIYSRTPYMLLAVLLWYFTHESGLHATLAGVLTAVMIPSREPGNVGGVAAQAEAVFGAKGGQEVSTDGIRILQNAIDRLREPSYHLQHRLESWSNFLILPLFAFFNTGIVLNGSSFSATEPVNLGVILGLVIGKPLGIFLSCWLAVRLGIASLSNEINWTQILGAGCLAGVGFTMSIFIATSAFELELLNNVKLSVLIASIIAASLGILILMIAKANQR